MFSIALLREIFANERYVKDIKNALLAADIIVNEWGFKDYRLDIYGGLDRTPSYTVECQEIIASKALRGYVTLKGYGSTHQVLKDTWVFMNSSISEGLPLAIGEAALTGAPIVCTDVGATFQVLTDPDDPKKRYGAVIAPNDYRGLARAQISLLAVMGEWEEYGEDEVSPGPMPVTFTPEDVSRITERMYNKGAQRRKLGLQLRGVVQKSFSGDRYLREHEQMLWIGKHQNQERRRRIALERGETVIDIFGEGDIEGYCHIPAVQTVSEPRSPTYDFLSPAEMSPDDSQEKLFLSGEDAEGGSKEGKRLVEKSGKLC